MLLVELYIVIHDHGITFRNQLSKYELVVQEEACTRISTDQFYPFDLILHWRILLCTNISQHWSIGTISTKLQLICKYECYYSPLIKGHYFITQVVTTANTTSFYKLFLLDYVIISYLIMWKINMNMNAIINFLLEYEHVTYSWKIYSTDCNNVNQLYFPRICYMFICLIFWKMFSKFSYVCLVFQKRKISLRKLINFRKWLSHFRMGKHFLKLTFFHCFI